MEIKQIIEKLKKYNENDECEIYITEGCESQKILKIRKSKIDKNKVVIFPKYVMISFLKEIKWERKKLNFIQQESKKN